MNPYVGKGFFGFLHTFFSRLFIPHSLASDEVQLLTFLCIGISAAICGTFLVLRHQAMLANALSHTVFLGLVVVFWIFGAAAVTDMKILGVAALLTALFTTWLVSWLTRTLRMQRESAIALVFTTLFSLAVAIGAVLTKNLHLGIESVSGSGDLLVHADLKIGSALALSTAVLLLLFYKPLKLSTFDEAYSASMGVSTRMINLGLMCQSAACIIGGMRSVGVVMILVFFVAPPLFARLFSRHLSQALWIAVLLTATCILVGAAAGRALLTNYYIPLSTGALVATLVSLAPVFALIWKKSAAIFIRK